jgi:hypothetical protein
MKVCLCARYGGIGGLEVRIHSFFFFTLDGGNGLASCIGHCSSVKRATVKTEQDFGPQNASGNFLREKNLFCLRFVFCSLCSLVITSSELYWLETYVEIPYNCPLLVKCLMQLLSSLLEPQTFKKHGS